MSERPITLRNFFVYWDVQYYGCLIEREVGVVDKFNDHLYEWPVDYSYKDAIEGALVHGWFRVNPDGSPGVSIDVGEEAPVTQ